MNESEELSLYIHFNVTQLKRNVKFEDEWIELEKNMKWGNSGLEG